MLSRTDLADPSRHSNPNPCRFNRLQPLCLLFPAPVLCFQQLAASFPKIPGVGYPKCNYGTPGWGLPRFTFQPPTTHYPLLTTHSPLTTFRINTCKSVSKQSTLTIFRMNTYAKQGEGGGRPKISFFSSTLRALNPQNPAGWPSALRWPTKKRRRTMGASAAVLALVRDGRFASTDAGASSLQRRTPSHPQGFWLASR